MTRTWILTEWVESLYNLPVSLGVRIIDKPLEIDPEWSGAWMELQSWKCALLIAGRLAPLRRLERRHLPPEGNALSTELQGRVDRIVTQPMGSFKREGATLQFHQEGAHDSHGHLISIE